jgi:hypothetical protein
VIGWEVRDYEGTLVTVGATVLYNDESRAVVESISEPDGDYDDELQRAVEYPPRVTVRFPDGNFDKVRSYNDTTITWADYPDGPVLSTYRVDDLKVVAS